MAKLRILYMGTPAFSTTILRGLIDNGYTIVGLISQPDRPVGRKKIIEPTPTKVVALENDIPVYQVENIRHEYEFIKDINPDIIITCAYGQIIPQAVLDIPRLGCINVHASLLPKLRGGAPIQHAIIDGLKETGITIMEMAAGMDSGAIYLQKATPISDDDNLETLSNRLSEMGKDLLLEFLPLYLEGKLTKIPQDESEVSFAYNIKKEEEEIDWSKEARAVFNKIRGLYPKPGAYAILDDQIIKIYKTEIVEEKSNLKPGTINVNSNELIVSCGKGSVRILELQPAGKKIMEISQYLNGAKALLKDKKFKVMGV